MDCRGCRYYHNLADNHCFGCDGRGYTRPSNADRIRTMTDEELANYIWQLQNTKERRSTNGWLDWLKKEADNG